MSFHPMMFQPAPAGTARQFLVQINEHAEVVVYQLGDNGVATTFTVSRLGDLLLNLARDRYPDAQVFLHERDHGLVYSLTRVNFGTFAECADELNRPGPRRVKGRRLDDVVRQFRHPIHKYLERHPGGWRPTAAGLAYDAEFYPPKPEPAAGSPAAG